MTVNDFPYTKNSLMTCVENKLHKYYIFTREENMIVSVEIFEGASYKLVEEFKIDTRNISLAQSSFADWLKHNKVIKIDIHY